MLNSLQNGYRLPVLRGGLTVRVQSPHWAVLFLPLFFFPILVSLFMAFLSLQTIVNMWQHFLKYFLKAVIKIM